MWCVRLNRFYLFVVTLPPIEGSGEAATLKAGAVVGGLVHTPLGNA